MANDNPVNVQDVFLNHVRKNKTPLTVFLLNGVKLKGVVTWFDSFSMLLRRDGHSQLVYKHAISTIMPEEPIKVSESSIEEPLSEDQCKIATIYLNPDDSPYECNERLKRMGKKMTQICDSIKIT